MAFAKDKDEKELLHMVYNFFLIQITLILFALFRGHLKNEIVN